MNKKTEIIMHLSGWIFFLICAVLFAVSGILTADLLITAGSIIFFIACIFFLIPLVLELKYSGKKVRK